MALLSSVSNFSAGRIVSRCERLADTAPGFRVRKSDLDIPAVFHRFSERIRAHTLICFLALFLCRVMRMHLKENGNADSLKTPFEFLHPRQTHRIYIGKMRLTGIGKTALQQRELFAALGNKKPS